MLTWLVITLVFLIGESSDVYIFISFIFIVSQTIIIIIIIIIWMYISFLHFMHLAQLIDFIKSIFLVVVVLCCVVLLLFIHSWMGSWKSLINNNAHDIHCMTCITQTIWACISFLNISLISQMTIISHLPIISSLNYLSFSNNYYHHYNSSR